MNTPILPADQMHTAYYLRLSAQDHPGVLSDVTGILSRAGINIDAILQKPMQEKGNVPVIILTQTVLEATMNAAIRDIEALTAIEAPVVRIRLETLDG